MGERSSRLRCGHFDGGPCPAISFPQPSHLPFPPRILLTAVLRSRNIAKVSKDVITETYADS
jgi:hypothetical protein